MQAGRSAERTAQNPGISGVSLDMPLAYKAALAHNKAAA